MPVSSQSRGLALAGLVVTLALLVPGLILPVITVRGVLQPAGMAELAPRILNDGISEQSIATIKPLINPAPLLEMSLARIGGGLAAWRPAVQQLRNGKEIEVYHRPAASSDRCGTYRFGMTAATLILLFSVIVPFGRRRWSRGRYAGNDAQAATLHFVEWLPQGSMATSAVALFITYLAARRQAPGATTASVVAFGLVGAGHFMFAAYLFHHPAGTQILDAAVVKTCSRTLTFEVLLWGEEVVQSAVVLALHRRCRHSCAAPPSRLRPDVHQGRGADSFQEPHHLPPPWRNRAHVVGMRECAPARAILKKRVTATCRRGMPGA
jgi:hypothetical protein